MVTKTCFCPHRPEENCNCRKPKLGMIFEAEKEIHIDINESVIIGDRDDMEREMGRRWE